MNKIINYDHIPAYAVNIDAGKRAGALDTRRLCLGIGGINSIPAEKIIGETGMQAVQALDLPMIRIFLQQYLDPLRGDDSYDWAKMDAYVGSAARLGNVMAAFCLKPAALFGKKDQTIVYPRDKKAFADYITAIAARYDGVITHWEAGNETDIGESGGCPLIIKDDGEYNEYYRFMAEALLKGSSRAKMGGSALANAAGSSQLSSLIEYCRAGAAPLDFISWHLYSTDNNAHAALVRKYAALLEGWPGGRRPLMTVTEWACDFPGETGAVVETADEPKRAAAFFAACVGYLNEGLDYSFFYHLHDCTFYYDDFEPFFENPQGMDKHWNQIPHRFGMFAHDGKPRPHYHLWRMMREVGGEKLEANSEYPDFITLCGADGPDLTLIIANFNLRQPRPVIADARFAGLEPGIYDIVTEQLYGRENISRDGYTMEPIDKRDISTAGAWRCPIYLPPYSVVKISMKKV